MSDEDALLAAVAENPEEDTPRLVYADWLDENADALPDAALARAWAELIRVQTERLRCPYWLPAHTPRYGELLRRERDLHFKVARTLVRPGGAWEGIDVQFVPDVGRLPLFEQFSERPGVVVANFSRGLPTVRMDAEAFLRLAPRFARPRPPELTVTGAFSVWYDLATHEHFPIVTHLIMVPAPATEYFRSGTWSLGASILGRIGELIPNNRLRGLDFSLCRTGDAGLSHLAEHPEAWRLENLDASHNGIEYGGLVDLLYSPIPRTLRRVNLCGNPITDLGARVLAERWPADGPLEWLRLEGTAITEAGRDVLRERFGEKVEFGPGL